MQTETSMLVTTNHRKGSHAKVPATSELLQGFYHWNQDQKGSINAVKVLETNLILKLSLIKVLQRRGRIKVLCLRKIKIFFSDEATS